MACCVIIAAFLGLVLAAGERIGEKILGRAPRSDALAWRLDKGDGDAQT